MTPRQTDAMLRQWDETFNLRKTRPVRTRGLGTVPEQGGGGAADAIRQRLLGNVRRTPQAMVRISGGGRGMRHIRAHLDYISRHGRLPVESEDGDRHIGGVEVEALGDEWQHAGMPIPDVCERREAVNIVLSMPEGTDPEALLRAVRDFARDTFSGHQYAMVLHRYEDDPGREPARHPHVHLCVKKAAGNGERLNPRKDDLRQWRCRFAERLRAHGIDAMASSRIERFQRQKGIPQSVYHLRERNAQNGHDTWVTSPAVREAAQRQQQTMLQRYASVARILAGANDAPDRLLAVELVGLCQRAVGMPVERERAAPRERQQRER